MNIWSNLIDALSRRLKTTTSLKIDAELESLLHTALATSETGEGLERLRSETYRIEETGAVYDDAKVILLHTYKGWTVHAGRYGSDAQFAKTNPCPSMFAMLSDAEAVALHEYDIDGNMSDFSTRRSWHLTNHRERTIEPGQPYVLDGSDTATYIRGKSETIEFVRVLGPAKSPLVYGFDLDTGGFAYSAFADEIITSRAFLLEVVHLCLSDHNLAGALDLGDVEAIAVDLDRRLNFPGLDDSSTWRCLQALGLVSPDRAFAALEDQASHSNSEMAARASVILAHSRTHTQEIHRCA